MVGSDTLVAGLAAQAMQPQGFPTHVQYVGDLRYEDGLFLSSVEAPRLTVQRGTSPACQDPRSPSEIRLSSPARGCQEGWRTGGGHPLIWLLGLMMIHLLCMIVPAVCGSSSGSSSRARRPKRHAGSASGGSGTGMALVLVVALALALALAVEVEVEVAV